MRTSKKFYSIKTRLVFWFLIMAIVPLLAGMTYTYYQRVNSIKEQTAQKLSAIRDLKKNELNSWLDHRISDIETIAGDLEIRGLENVLRKESRDLNDEKIMQKEAVILKRYLNNYTDYCEIFIMNPSSGKIEISANESLVGLIRSAQTYFTEPLQSKKVHIEDIFYSEKLRKPCMTFSMPVFCLEQKGEHIVGILVTVIDLERTLYPLLLNRTGMGETGETLIVNKNGIALNELRSYKDAPLRLKIQAKHAIDASHGLTGIAETKDYNNIKVLSAYTQIQKTGWGLVAKQDLKEIYAPINVMMIHYLLIIIAALGLSYLLARFLAKIFSSPILEVTHAAEFLQQGDLTARSHVDTQDELGMLSQSFNTMADTILSELSIQEKVKDLTETMVAAKELQDFRRDLLKKLVDITDSNMGAYHLLNLDNNMFEHFTSIGVSTEMLKPFDASILEGEFGKALKTKKIVHLKDIPQDTIYTFKTFTGTMLPREIINIPIVIEGVVLAIVSLAKIDEYSKESLEIINNAWININITFSNLLANTKTRRLATELTGKNKDLQNLTHELERQTEELQSQTEELFQQNTELDLQKKQIEEANRLKSEFLSNMSHELRTPLNSIMALSRVLMMQANNSLAEEELNYLTIIIRNGQKLLSLINDILDLSKIEAGRMDVSVKSFPLSSTIEAVMDSIEPIAKEKGVETSITIQDNLVQIESDESRIYNILQNLVGNAVKFTEQGSVKVSVRADSENIFIEIADTGIGIPEEQLSHIFEEFRQIDGSTSRKYEGTGLGLAIAYKLAHILGGDIIVKSMVGKGSTFTLSLPVSWQGTSHIIDFSFDEEQSTYDQSKTSVNRPGAKILLVEDSESAIIQVKTVLEHEGYIVDVARGGKEALDCVKHTIPDGIILDLMMPEIDGFDVLEKIRSSKSTAQIPVLILTAKDLTHEDLKKLSTNNIQQLIQKGDVDKEGLLFKTRLMLGTQPRPYPYLKYDAPASNQHLSDREMNNSREETHDEYRSGGSSLGNRTILIIEDNPDNMVTIKTVLRDDFSLMEAGNGEEGLAKVLTESPDLILLDIGLPGMDGYEVIRRIKESNEHRHIPVIAVTAHAMKGIRDKIIMAGFNDYVSKPIDPETILRMIRTWL